MTDLNHILKHQNIHRACQYRVYAYLHFRVEKSCQYVLWQILHPLLQTYQPQNDGQARSFLPDGKMSLDHLGWKPRSIRNPAPLRYVEDTAKHQDRILIW
ncbi:hypothetical protein D3C72_1287830 [compost metagenome]